MQAIALRPVVVPGNISGAPLMIGLEGDIQLAADCCGAMACGDSICRNRIKPVGT